jgi:glycosyltransferase involved in cell wall biosynthesis
VDRILDAIAELDGSYSLRITGEGSDRARLVAHAAALGLDSRAQFLGNVDRGELLRWFRTARVYITMSRIEAMPLTPLEVLQAGAAVVASDIDAHREVADATRGNIELVASDASPAEIARAIERAAVATPVRPSVLDWSEVGDSTLALYDEVMSLRSARS